MKTRLLIKSKGFDVVEPTFEYSLLTSFMFTGFTSRDFGHLYENMDEQIAGNLYLWIQQSYRVLWAVNVNQNRVILYSNTIDKLGERFATLLRIPTEEGKAATLEMVKSVSLSNFIIEDVVFKIKGNWLLKYGNPSLNGMLKHFVFWMASLEIEDKENAQKCLAIFIKKFAKDVDFQVIYQYPQDVVMNAFMQCFLHGKNDMDIFLSVIQNPNLSFHEHR
jgi:hypothetical protein